MNDRHVPILAIEDARVWVADGTPILNGISWTIHRGEHWALLGPNGSGKSTLLSLAGAVRHPSAGSVTVLGGRLGQVSLWELRERIGVVDPAIGQSEIDRLIADLQRRGLLHARAETEAGPIRLTESGRQAALDLMRDGFAAAGALEATSTGVGMAVMRMVSQLGAAAGISVAVAARGAHGFVFAYGVLGVFTVLATVAAARVVADGTPEPPLENPDISVVIGSPLC